MRLRRATATDRPCALSLGSRLHGSRQDPAFLVQDRAQQSLPRSQPGTFLFRESFRVQRDSGDNRVGARR